MQDARSAAAPRRVRPGKGRAARVRPRVAVLGGGFAGVAAVQELAGRARVTWIDARDAFEFLPNIHELLSRVKTPQLLRLPLRDLARRSGARLLHARVAWVDAEARRVVTEDGRSVRWDALVLALGGVHRAPVPGADEHALPFKSVRDVARIAARLDALAGVPGGPHPVAIVGGGLEGVEALGEILRRDPEGRALRPVLLEAGPRVLPAMPAGVARAVVERAGRRGGEVRAGVAVSAVRADAVVLADGARVPSACTIWTGGPAPSPVLAASGLAEAGAWAPVARTLQHRSHPALFVAGDAAGLPRPVAKQAYHALDMGAHAARSALRLLGGAEPRPFRPLERPALLAFGDLDTFLVAGRLALASPLLAAAKETVFETVMGRLDARPAPQRALAAADRLLLAAGRLVWPAVASPWTLLRTGRVELLGAS